MKRMPQKNENNLYKHRILGCSTRYFKSQRIERKNQNVHLHLIKVHEDFEYLATQ